MGIRYSRCCCCCCGRRPPHNDEEVLYLLTEAPAVLGQPVTEPPPGAILALEARQDALRAQVLSALTEHPRTGLYPGETEADWNTFVAHVLAVCSSDEGSRGEVRVAVREQMRTHVDELVGPLKEIGCTVDDPIADIELAFRQLSRGAAAGIAAKCDKRVAILEQRYNDLSALSSRASLGIIQGLLAKGKTEKEARETLEQILADKEVELLSSRAEAQAAHQQLLKDPEFLRWHAIETALEPYIDQWKGVDKSMGRNSNARGNAFEQACTSVAVALVAARIGLPLSQARIARNLRWEGTAGEVDLALLHCVNGRQPRVAALIECKAHLFDIAHAYTHQSGPDARFVAGKNTLLIPGLNSRHERVTVPVTVPYECPCFVITRIPPHQYHLGFETYLRDLLNKPRPISFKNVPTPEMYSQLREKFANRVPPHVWLHEMGGKFLIVLE